MAKRTRSKKNHLPPNYILEYWGRIESGEIAVGKRIRQQYEKLVDDIKNPKDPYVFDIELATKPIEFIESLCKQAQGSKAGQPLKLELFQKAKYQAIFGFVHKDTRLRQYTEVMTIEGRKNGKTTENSALSLFMLIGDGEGSAENYFIATKREQANKGFEEALKMVKQSPALSKYIKKRHNDMYFAASHSKIQSLASDSNSLDGLNSHFVTVDELAAIKDRNIYDVMKQSTSSREQPLVSSISTNGFNRLTVYDSQYEYGCRVLDGEIEDRHFLSFFYELDDPSEWTDPDAWIKANPGLGTIKDKDTLAGFVEKAKVDDGFRPTVLTKDFNLSSNPTQAWLPMDILDNPATFNLPDLGIRYGIGGIDKSDTTDLTAAVVLMRRPDDPTIYVKSMFWLPSQTIEQRAEEDGIPYDLFERQGYLRGSGDYTVETSDIINWFREVKDDDDVFMSWIGYDRWGIQDYDLEQFERYFGKNAMTIVRQGAQTLSAPMKELKGDLKGKVINYNNNPLLKMCLANTEIKSDDNGNIRPVKGRDRRKRIDGTIALLCAYRVYKDHYGDYLARI